MADDIPIFEQKTGIQQGGQLPAVGQALAKKPNYALDTKKSLTDLDYYSKYAQQASQELGGTLGQIRGERPGGFVVPEIFENQKSFHDAYKKEELVNLSYDGQLALEKMKLLAARNPTRGNLQTYQKEGNKVIEDILDISSPGNKNELKRYLESNFDNGALHIAEGNFKKEQQDMLHQGNIKQDQAIKNVYNNSFTGNKELSEKDKEVAIANVYSMINSHLINAEEGVKRIETIEKMQTRGEFDAKAKEWTDNGTFEENIKQYAQNKPENVTPIEHQENLSNMMQYHNQYQSALSGQQYLTYMGTLNQIQSGVQLTPTQLDTAKQDMGPSYAVKLEHDLIKVSSKQNEVINLSNEMQPDIGNAVKMSKWSDGDVDKVFNLRLGQAAEAMGVSADEIPLTAQTQIASGMGAPVKSVGDKVGAAITNGSVQQGSEALRAVQFARTANSNVLDGLGQQELGIALKANKLRIGGNADEEALLKAREEVLKKDDAKNLQSLKTFHELTGSGANAKRGKNLKDFKEATNYAAETCGFVGADLPPGFVDIFSTNLESNYKVTDDLALAEEMTREKIRKTYGDTNINGYREVMYLPPEKFLPGGAADIERMKLDLLEKANETFKKTKELFDQGKSMVWYEFIDEKGYSEVPGAPTYKKVVRHDTFGDEIKGELVMSAGNETSLPSTGFMPNYAIELDINGLRSPIQLPDNPSELLHYQPGFYKLQEKYSVTPEKVERSKENFKKRKEILDLIRENTLENQYE